MIFDEYAIKSLIRPVPGFPKEGVTFRDITPLFQSPKALRMVADSLIQRYIDSPVTHIGAIDARGFLIGSILAYELNRPLVLFRKAGKLPADTLSANYQTEYGEATLQMHRDALSGGEQVLLLDEPFDGVDPLGVEATLEVVADARSRGAAVLVSTHLRELAIEACSTVSVLRGGAQVAEMSALDMAGEEGARAYRSPLD